MVNSSISVSQLIKFLMEKSVIVQVWGKQSMEKKPINTAAKKGKDTKAIMRAETMKRSVSHFSPPFVLRWKAFFKMVFWNSLSLKEKNVVSWHFSWRYVCCVPEHKFEETFPCSPRERLCLNLKTTNEWKNLGRFFEPFHEFSLRGIDSIGESLLTSLFTFLLISIRLTQ